MTYVLLPYMVLTLYSVMRGHRPGPRPRRPQPGREPRSQAFRRVFLPLSLPGIAGGTLLVFILSLGFFITPALMGGPADVMIAMLIEREVEITLNWSFASALAVILLALTLVGFVGLQPHRPPRAHLRGPRDDHRGAADRARARWRSSRCAGAVLALPDRARGDHRDRLVQRRRLPALPAADPVPPLVPALPRHRGWRRSIGVSAQVAVLTMVFATALGLPRVAGAGARALPRQGRDLRLPALADDRADDHHRHRPLLLLRAHQGHRQHPGHGPRPHGAGAARRGHHHGRHAAGLRRAPRAGRAEPRGEPAHRAPPHHAAAHHAGRPVGGALRLPHLVRRAPDPAVPVRRRGRRR